MRNFINLIFISFSILFLASCEKEKTSKVSLKLSLMKGSFKKSLTASNTVNAKLTLKVKTKNGLVNKFDKKIVKVLDVTSSPSIELDLDDNNPNQAYQIEEFHVGRGTVVGAYSESSQNALNFFVPLKNTQSSLAVNSPLPRTFVVTAGAISHVDGAVSSSISLELVSTKPKTMPRNPAQTLKTGIINADFFNYGIKTLKVGRGYVESCVFKVQEEKNSKFETKFYNIPTNYVNDQKHFPYFKLKTNAAVKYKFEISKFGYKTQSKQYTVAQMKKGTFSSAVSLDSVSLDNIYVKYPSSSEFQRGGADFKSTAYWDYLPELNSQGHLLLKNGVYVRDYRRFKFFAC